MLNNETIHKLLLYVRAFDCTVVDCLGAFLVTAFFFFVKKVGGGGL